MIKIEPNQTEKTILQKKINEVVFKQKIEKYNREFAVKHKEVHEGSLTSEGILNLVPNSKKMQKITVFQLQNQKS